MEQVLNAREQFGRQAAEYATSLVHSSGADRAVERLGAQPGWVVLDVGTGAGHTAHALARRCRYVIASDITPEMLNQTRRLAREQGLANVQPAFSLAENLPFAAAAFDGVTCRLAAHHFRDARAFCAEVARVLRPGGHALFIDTAVPEDAAAAAFINDIEMHRDHSHIEDYSGATWRRMVEEAGLRIAEMDVRTGDLAGEELVEWARRAGTAEEDVEYIRRRFAEAPTTAAEAMNLRPENGTFRWSWPVVTILAQR